MLFIMLKEVLMLTMVKIPSDMRAKPSYNTKETNVLIVGR